MAYNQLVKIKNLWIMKNLINYILQHKGKQIFEPILTTHKDYSITSMQLGGVDYYSAKKICKELNELLLKVRDGRIQELI
jgi:hypothetical protein